MTDTLSDHHRRQIASLAAVIAPGWQHMPSADDIALSGAPLDRVLQARPDLLTPLCAMLGSISKLEPEAGLRYLEREEPQDFQTLLTVVAAAYHMHPSVMAALGYHGQEAQSLPRDGFGAEEEVMEMMAKPPRYRRPPQDT